MKTSLETQFRAALRGGCSVSEVLESLAPDIRQFRFIELLKTALPQIPLRTLIDLSLWTHVLQAEEGGHVIRSISSEELDRLLAKWTGPHSRAE